MKITFVKIIFLFLFLITNSLFAFIPSSDFIASKITKNSGTGIYQLKQELVFTSQSRPVTITETWWIQSDDVMFLKSESALFNFYILYKNGKKYFFNEQKSLVTASQGSDFYMPLYFKRNPQELRESLIRRKLAPVQTFKKRPQIKIPKDAQTVAQTQEPYLKLDRIKNTSVILLGFAAQDNESGGLWIDQDRFLIKKIRFNSKTELQVESFSELSRGLIFPKNYSVLWDEQTAQVELTSGISLTQPTQFFNEAEVSKLSDQYRAVPNDFSSVIDFYKRFR